MPVPVPELVPRVVKDVEDRSRIEVLLRSLRVECPRCGTLRQPRESSPCRACGEAVIVWGWML